MDAGSEISFVIGLLQFSASVFCEGLNVYMLCTKTEVFECIHYFVSLEIVMELSRLYVERLKDNKLKDVMHHQDYRAKNKGSKIKFMERSLFHKIARIIYKFIRSIYVSVIFYFVPFYILLGEFILTGSK